MIVLQCIRVLEWAIYWPSFYDVIMRDWRASRGFWLYLFTTIKRYCSSARRPSQRKMYAKQAGGSGDRFSAHRNCYSAREGEIWLRHVCRTFCAYSHHRKAAFCTPKQEESTIPTRSHRRILNFDWFHLVWILVLSVWIYSQKRCILILLGNTQFARK